MKVKDVSVLFDNLCGFDYRVISDFYDEDGFYIGQINKNYVNGELFVSDEMREYCIAFVLSIKKPSSI